MARVLITGGAGFIGSHVVDAFSHQGHELAIIDDLSSGVQDYLPGDARFFKCDIRSNEARQVVREFAPQIIAHLAAQMSVRISMERPTLDTDVNVTGLVNLLDACEEGAMPHVVFASTGGAIYGEQETFPADEDHPIRPTSVYGLSKRVGEMYLDFWKRERGLRFTALRLGNVYGPRQNPHGEAGVVAIFCERMLDRQTPVINGTGEQTRDFVFVGDVARAFIDVAGRSVQGTFNIGTGRESSVNDVFRHLNEALGLKVTPKYGAAKQGEQMRSCISAERARDEFGWNPIVTLEEGLQSTAQWFQKRHAMRKH